MNLIKPFKILLLFAALPLGVFAQNIIPLDPDVRTGKLPNGFTYFIRHNEEPKNRVLMYLVNKAGSILEDEDQRGLAHFTEHMSFNGTKHFPHNQLVDYLQKAGVRFGADINAYTSFDETVYQLPIPSDNPKLLKGGLEIMRDWAQEALLDPAEIDKERGVVLEEKRLGKGAGERMRTVYWPVILQQSRYATRMPIGLDTVLNNFKRPVIARFYHDWYRPDLQALIIVGDIDVNQVEQSVKAQFSNLKNPEHEKARPQFTVPLTGKNQFVAVTDKEMTSTVMEVIIKHKAPQLKTTDDFRNNVIQLLFMEMLGARYLELSRLADPPFVNGGAGISDFIGGLDCYDASVVAKPGELEKGFKAVWRETERVKRFGFTATELQRAKAGLLTSVESSYKEQNKTNSEFYVKQYQEYFLKNTPALGIAASYKLVKNYLPGITLAEVNRLTAEYIRDTDQDVLIEAPDKDKNSLPDETIVKAWLTSVANEKLEPYKDEVSTQPLLANQPLAGKIVSTERNNDLKFTTITLSNGVKVILKPTDFKNNEIMFNAFAPGGTSIYDDADFESAAAAVGLITAGGVGNYDANQLQKFMADKESAVSPFISDRSQGISGNTTPKDLETALALTYAYFTEPRKDTAIFKGIIGKSRANLANRSDDPGSVFSDTVSAVLSNYNVRRTGPTIEKLNQVNLDRAYSIFKERFSDAGNFTFTFVGSIDTNTIKPLLEKYLGSLPSRGLHEQARDLGIHIPPGKIEKTVYKGSEPQASVMLVFSGKYDYSPESNVCMDALKEALEIRLLQRLREDESGVYTPSVSNVISKFPQSRYAFMIRFGCAPQNVDKLVASTLDEINKLRTEGPLKENVDKWRAESKTSIEPNLKTNGFWLGYINAQLQNQDDLGIINHYSAILDEVGPGDVKTMALKYLSGDNFIKIELKPEADNNTRGK
ncbi:M16 family metallopeptidase [Mucilaginibacter gotjawali]|uniref:Protease 3 n=2 Tax=Mucilaginibacter gotjawali TaxID=1550579 RepID=A0A0X8X1G8_9SPHI|nr:M16 family metallopeptidase [Mucilaginibacter gotjawali]MBB3053812.1 zinc protease [Mucilaginibacter gotjawali]BAU54075.1 Protease 3 precursor [Mucilaginibacter gotjawali]